MKTIIKNLALCTDCTQAAVNDDYTGLDYHYNEEDAARRMKEIQSGLINLGAGLCYDNNQEGDEFSTRPCDCCGSRLAGRREYFVVIR